MKIIVIGATGTIGRAVADSLSVRHQVIRASRGSEVHMDIEDAASVTALFDKVEKIDAVVSCAPSVGRAMGSRGLLGQLRDEQFELAITWMMAQVNLVRTGLKRLRDGGSITLTTGALAARPMPGTSALSMAAAGLEGFVRAAALELPRGQRINCVSPGWIKETMEQAGMDSTLGMPARTLAGYYVSAVEGAMNGTVIDPTTRLST